MNTMAIALHNAKLISRCQCDIVESIKSQIARIDRQLIAANHKQDFPVIRLLEYRRNNLQRKLGK